MKVCILILSNLFTTSRISDNRDSEGRIKGKILQVLLKGDTALQLPVTYALKCLYLVCICRLLFIKCIYFCINGTLQFLLRMQCFVRLEGWNTTSTLPQKTSIDCAAGDVNFKGTLFSQKYHVFMVLARNLL